MEYNREITRLSQMFSILGEESRLAIVIYLMNKEASVSEITEKLHMTQSAVSHQLRILRDTQTVKKNKKGRHVYYSINDEHVQTIVESGLKHMLH